MLKVTGHQPAEDGHLDVRFSESRQWEPPPGFRELGADNPLDTVAIVFGDQDTGPVLFLHAVVPGVEFGQAEAHGHASDNWRIALRGGFKMGRHPYGPGDFRFQEGWRSYPSDNLACGPEGGWIIVGFMNRRGSVIRPVSGIPWQETVEGAQDGISFANWAGVPGDYHDLDDAPGPAGAIASLGPFSNAGHINGRFAETGDWDTDAEGRRVCAAVFTEQDNGPGLLQAVTPAGLTAMPDSSDTDVVRLVVAGSCVIDGTEYGPGDIRAQRAGGPSHPAIAGPDGLSEVIFYGNRQPMLAADSDTGWPTAAVSAVRKLKQHERV